MAEDGKETLDWNVVKFKWLVIGKQINMIYIIKVLILWNVDPLPGNDQEISNRTTAVTRQWIVSSNRGQVFSAVSAEML
jgi:hypothetical protein